MGMVEIITLLSSANLIVGLLFRLRQVLQNDSPLAKR